MKSLGIQILNEWRALMMGKKNPRTVDVLAVFENWLLKRRSDIKFRKDHNCAALDSTSIVHREDGGILAIDIRILERTDSRLKRSLPASKIADVTFHDEPQANPFERLTNHDNEFPIRSSLKRKICPECIGEKKKICRICFGLEKKEKCSACAGAGFRICTTCHGEGNLFDFETLVQKYRTHKNSIQLISKDPLTESITEEMKEFALSSSFDAPLRSLHGKIQSEKNWLVPDCRLDKYLLFATLKFSWPISAEDFSRTIGIDSSGLKYLLAEAKKQIDDIIRDYNLRYKNITRTEFSAEFTPINHIIFSESEKYNKQFQFSLIGTSEGYTILPPRLSFEFSSQGVHQVTGTMALFGLFFWVHLLAFFPIHPDFALLYVLGLMGLIGVLYYSIAQGLTFDSIEINKKNLAEEKGWFDKLKMLFSSSNPSNNSEKSLLLLTGSDSPEKDTFFCLLNLELCRKRKIAVSDLWHHKLLALFLNAEKPTYGSSFLCIWEILNDKSPSTEENPSENYNKNNPKRKQILHFLDAHPSILRINEQLDSKHIIHEVNNIIYFLTHNTAELNKGDIIEQSVKDIISILGKITSIRECKSSIIPLFVIFNGFESDDALKVISELGKEKIEPQWDIVDIGRVKTQYLEGESEKYENFINKIWDFVRARG